MQKSAAGGKRGLMDMRANAQRREFLSAGLVLHPVLLESNTANAEAANESGSLVELPKAPKDKNRQRSLVKDAMVSYLKENIQSLDLQEVLQLFWADAATYDRINGTGGVNGSVFLELDRPEVAPVRNTAEQLLQMKNEAEQRCSNPNGISAADFLCFAARMRAKKARRFITQMEFVLPCFVPSVWSYADDVRMSVFSTAWNQTFDEIVAQNSGDERYINIGMFIDRT